MIYAATCLNCGHTICSTHRSNSCSVCGMIMMTETNPERDKRLGITKKDIRSFDNKDPLLAHLDKKKKVIRCG